jgi:hypothetical protein
MEVWMNRIVTVFVAAGIGLGATLVMAASPAVNAAIKAMKAVAADPAKLKTYCAMQKATEALGEKEDAAAEAKIDAMAKQLGPEFNKAMEAVGDLDEKTADGKEYYAVVEEIDAKCS